MEDFVDGVCNFTHQATSDIKRQSDGGGHSSSSLLFGLPLFPFDPLRGAGFHGGRCVSTRARLVRPVANPSVSFFRMQRAVRVGCVVIAPRLWHGRGHVLAAAAAAAAAAGAYETRATVQHNGSQQLGRIATVSWSLTDSS